MNFKERSRQSELLDEAGIPADALHKNLYELSVINRWLGGHEATRFALNKIITDKKRLWRILDFGCGGGDSLRFIARWATKNGIKVELHGVDLLPEAIAYARSQPSELPIHYHCADFNDFSESGFDIAFSSLFCHHLYDEDLTNLLNAKINSAEYAFVNDLHRHPLAYWSIKVLTGLFSRSYLVKNDAPVSVCRAFKRSDWHEILKSVNANTIGVHWRWAFRWVVIVKNSDAGQL